MKKRLGIVVGVVLLSGLAIGAGRGVVYRTAITDAWPADRPPPATRRARPDGGPVTPRQFAAAQRRLAESLVYRGTRAIPNLDLDPDDARVQKVCAMLAKADFVPELRVRRFAGLDPAFVVVGWDLTVMKLDVRENDSLVQVAAWPQLKWAGGEGGSITCVSNYSEEYRVVGGKLQFLGGEPLKPDMPIRYMTD
jgi:hypothetical protein